MSFLAMLGGLVAMITGPHIALVLCVGLVLVAAGYGLLAAAVPSVTRAAFGAVEFSRKFSLVFTAWGVAGLSAPWISGALFDATGDFRLALLSALGMTLLFGTAAAALIRFLRLNAI